MPEILEKALEHLPSRAADWIGLREVREKTTLRFVRDGKPELSDVNLSHGVMVEALVDGQFAYAATPDVSIEGIQKAAEQAIQLAKRAAPFQVFRFSEQQRPPIHKKYCSLVHEPLGSMASHEMFDLLTSLSVKLKISPKIIRTVASARLIESETRFVSTSGADGFQEFSVVSGDFSATAQEGSLVQRRSDGGFWAKTYQGGLEFLASDFLLERMKKISEQALELLSAEPCPTETASLILMPDQMMLQIHESIGHPLEIDRILGDERNYAGWSFVKLEDFGRLQYGSSLMNITFDPTDPRELASYAFDDIGSSAQKEFLIKDGILQRGLGSLESQARAKIAGVSNQRACLWNRAPIDRMANLNLEPGTSSLEEMISSVKRGVLMESNRSWSIDDFRNKFQFGCEYGKLIENGKITRTLRNPNYRGVSVPFWRSLKQVGTSSLSEIYGTPYCGKGEPNQVIRVGHASPPCLFENIEVFGGAS